MIVSTPSTYSIDFNAMSIAEIRIDLGQPGFRATKETEMKQLDFREGSQIISGNMQMVGAELRKANR